MTDAEIAVGRVMVGLLGHQPSTGDLMTMDNARESAESRPNPTGEFDGKTKASALEELLGKHELTEDEARKYAHARAAAMFDSAIEHVAQIGLNVWKPGMTMVEFATAFDAATGQLAPEAVVR